VWAQHFGVAGSVVPTETTRSVLRIAVDRETRAVNA